MKLYYVVNCAVCFGFGGYIRRAFISSEEAQRFADTAAATGRFSDVTIYTTTAKNKTDAARAGGSMFAGEFAGMDIKNRL